MPFRLLATIQDNLQAGRPIDRLCVPIAAWMHFIRRKAHAGEQVVDPLASTLFEIGRSCQNWAASDLPLFLGLETVFPADLAANRTFSSAVGRAYDGLAAGS